MNQQNLKKPQSEFETPNRKGAFMLKKKLKLVLLVSIMMLATVSFSAAQEAKSLLKLPKAMEGATYVGMETCSSCHESEVKKYQLSTHARINVTKGGGEVEGCEMCHGPGSVHVDNGGGKEFILNPNKSPEVCFTCHTDKKVEFQLPYHHPVLEGKMSCTDCHDPHGADVRPWTAATDNDVNGVCFQCHTDKRGPFVWEHEALKEGCSVCHKVHGSINENMLVVRDNNLCLRCHAEAGFPNIGAVSHSGRLPQGTCFSTGCHEAVHGSNFYEKLRN